MHSNRVGAVLRVQSPLKFVLTLTIDIIKFRTIGRQKMIDFENIYNEYIKKENDKHKENYVGYEDWFSASSAGSCLKRQYYKHIKTEPTDLPDAQTLRKMRFGTILHRDLEKTVNWYKNSIKKN